MIWQGNHHSPKKELVHFGIFKDTINIKHGDYPEILIDKDIAVAILKKITKIDKTIPKPIKVQPITDLKRIIK